MNQSAGSVRDRALAREQQPGVEARRDIDGFLCGRRMLPRASVYGLLTSRELLRHRPDLSDVVAVVDALEDGPLAGVHRAKYVVLQPRGLSPVFAKP